MIAETQNAGTAQPSPDILATLRRASARTGSEFDYLLNTAMRESSLQPQAKSKHSSATGLFQFIDQTWLSLVKRFGAKHGLDSFAAAIERNECGTCIVASAEMKAAILALRNDPELSALMAGEAANESKTALEGALGRDVSCGELYAAHFLGQGGAKKLISFYEAEPDVRADLAFPQAAKANRSVFYHRDGTPKSIGELYAWVAGSPAAKPTAGVVGAVERTASVPQHPAVPASASSASRNTATHSAESESKGFSFGWPSLPLAALALTPAILDVLSSAWMDRRL